MICPECRQAMLVLELHAVEIDYCDQCHGIWLDAGELELLLADHEAKHTILESFAPARVKEKKLKCPICAKKMKKVQSGGPQGVVLDQCPRGHGLWFNRGELPELLSQGGLGKYDKNVVSFLNEMFAAEPVQTSKPLGDSP